MSTTDSTAQESGLITVGRNNRRYKRKFDHDLARELYAQGESRAALARRFGVSENGIRRVLDPVFRAKFDQRTNEYLRRTHRFPCEGGCGTLVWQVTRERSGFCAKCSAIAAAAPNVRPTELRCTKCGEWKPDEEFPVNNQATTDARRRRLSQCRSCSNAARRDYRRRHHQLERERDRARKNKYRKGKPVATQTYLVLKQEGGGWTEIGRAVASTPLLAAEEVAEGAGTFVAVAEGHILDVAPVTILKAVSRKNSKTAADNGN